MVDQLPYTIAIVGNPNCGKTSLFNVLTGRNHQVGNFPGVTVDRISAQLDLGLLRKVRIVDLPGTYSLFPNSLDEKIVTEVLIDPNHPDHPDLVIYVADAKQLQRQLLGFTQIVDLGFNCVLVLSMIDEFERDGHEIKLDVLRQKWGVPVTAVDNRAKSELLELKQLIRSKLENPSRPAVPVYKWPTDVLDDDNQFKVDAEHPYRHWLWMHHREWLAPAKEASYPTVREDFSAIKAQIEETFGRLDAIERTIQKAVRKQRQKLSLSERWDEILTHRIWGPLIFAVLMLLIFQAIFAWATYPMDWIESAFGWLGSLVSAGLPGGWLTDLITEGLIPGIAGVLVFVPQIAILFLLISILEEVGYMARAVYLFDRALQRYGMNGRSIVALISGGACAIPAVMSTRTIVNWKERLITIFVTPFISCSARIPVYTVLVAFVVPYQSIGGLFNTQGLAFAGLYVLGIVAALLSGWILKKIIGASNTSFFVLELPSYRMPAWRTVRRTVFSKVGTFIREAGKIILIISLLLWFLASFGPKVQMETAVAQAEQEAATLNLDAEASENLVAAKKIEASYAGILGKQIEPLIEPLGYDWKIGIGLLTAFAAREVFIGAMATIYSIGSEEDEFRIREHLGQQRDPVTGELIFNYATALSLLLFFVFAMQCMSTLAVVKAETQSWKWPILQFVAMTLIAYVAALLAYQIAS